MIKKYRKTAIVEALQLHDPELMEAKEAEEANEKLYKFLGDVPWASEGDAISIETLEGTMICHTGNYIVKGIKGEIHPVRKDIFEASYEEVKDNA